MFERKIVKTESVEEFLARGGKIQKFEVGDSTRKKIQQLQRLHKKLVLNGEEAAATKCQEMIDKYKAAVSTR